MAMVPSTLPQRWARLSGTLSSLQGSERVTCACSRWRAAAAAPQLSQSRAVGGKGPEERTLARSFLCLLSPREPQAAL